MDMEKVEKIKPQRKPGRPVGVKGPTSAERLRRLLKKKQRDLEAALVERALSGDTEALIACLTFLDRNPKPIPTPGSKPRLMDRRHNHKQSARRLKKQA